MYDLLMDADETGINVRAGLGPERQKMHPMLLNTVVNDVRRRISEGDCPVTQARSTETLEDAVNDLAREVERYKKSAPSEDSVPRRARLDRWTPAERAIFDAAQEVERVGADVRLTDAVCLLHAARESVADYVDGIAKRRAVAVTNGTPDQQQS